MIFYYNAGGDILSAIFDEVYQGSNKANTIYFVCPSARSNAVSVAFTLPDGTNTSRHVMELEGESGLDGVYDGEENVFNVWKYKVPSAITEKIGTVRVQFYVATPTETIATAAVDFTVRKGVSGVSPEIGDSYEELVSMMSEYSARMDDAEGDIADKADKVVGATNGNLAGLDGNGNLIDSGKKARDFAPASESYRFIKKIIVGYALTTSEPSNWATNWTSYYTNTGTDNNPTYTQVSDATAPTWVANTYYSKKSSNSSSRITLFSNSNYKKVLVNVSTVSAYSYSGILINTDGTWAFTTQSILTGTIVANGQAQYLLEVRDGNIVCQARTQTGSNINLSIKQF